MSSASMSIRTQQTTRKPLCYSEYIDYICYVCIHLQILQMQTQLTQQQFEESADVMTATQVH